MTAQPVSESTSIGPCPRCGRPLNALANGDTSCPQCEFDLLDGRWFTLEQILADPSILEPPEAVVPGLVFGGRSTLLSAQEKDVKSTYATAAASEVSRGGSEVLWLLLEEHLGDVASRFVRFGAEATQVHIVSHPVEPLAALAAATRTIRPALVVVDPLSRLVDGVVKDAASSAQWTPVMARLEQMARDTNAGLLVLHHATKTGTGYRDSSAIGAGVDLIAEMRRSKSGRTIRNLTMRGRIPIADFAVRLVGDRFVNVGDAVVIDDEIVAYVHERPGATKRQVRWPSLVETVTST